MNKNKTIKTVAYYLALLLIVFIGILVRGYQLGSLPAGLTWDEAAIGYNGFAIWETHRDEWLEFMPLTFRSFGDYKAPLAIYLNAPFTAVFGISPLSIRLPFFLASIATMMGMWWMWMGLLRIQRPTISLTLYRLTTFFIVLFIAFSPWQILFSRVGFESGLALAQIVLGAAAIIWSVSVQSSRWRFLLLIMGTGLFALAPYTYHSSKIVAPLLFFYLGYLLLKRGLMGGKNALIAGGVFVLGLLPLIYLSIFGNALTRAAVTVFSDGLTITTLNLLIKGIVSHLSPAFLLFGETDSLRHSTGVIGVLTSITLVLAGIGILGAVTSKVTRSRFLDCNQWSVIFWLAIGWIAIGLLPAMIGREIPHPNRALLALPGFIMLAVLGILVVWKLIINKLSGSIQKISLFVLLSGIVIIEFINLGMFLKIYFGEYQVESSQEYLAGYWEAAQLAYDHVTGAASPEFDQVLFSSNYGQPYIFVLAANALDPIAFHNGVLVNFFFPDYIQVGDLQRTNTLLIATQEDELEGVKADKVITDAAGQPRFYFYYVNE